MTAPAELAGALLSQEGRADPYPFYRALHTHGPLITITDELVLAVGYQAAEQALRQPDLLVEDADRADEIQPSWRTHAARATLLASLLCTNGARHELMRRRIGRAFTARWVAALRPKLVRVVGELLDHLADLGADGAPVDFVGEFAFRLPVTVICELLGVPEADRPAFRPLVCAVTSALEPGWAHADATAADRAAAELIDYFTALVAHRRAHPGDDLTSALTVSESDGQQLVPNLILLLVAGFETTMSLLGNGLAALAQRPAASRALRERPDRAPTFVEEMLRFDAPVQLTSRFARRDLTLNGVPVAAGGSVLVLLGAANRDPSRFAAPDEFDPDRPDNRPISFGGGAHFCIGASLARTQAIAAFPMLLARFGELGVVGTPRRHDRLNLRGFATLPVSLVRS